MSKADRITDEQIREFLRKVMAERGCGGLGTSRVIKNEEIDGRLRELVFVPLHLEANGDGYDWKPVCVAIEWGSFFEEHKLATMNLVHNAEKRGRIVTHIISAALGGVAVSALTWVLGTALGISL
jgi:hypothetical protein